METIVQKDCIYLEKHIVKSLLFIVFTNYTKLALKFFINEAYIQPLILINSTNLRHILILKNILAKINKSKQKLQKPE